MPRTHCDVRDTVIVNVIPSTESALAADKWQIKCTLWLEAMHVFWVSKGKQSRNQGKGKGKFKPNKTTNFKKKKNKAELPRFTCGELGHFSKDCPQRADRRGKRGGNGQSSKTVNAVIASKPEIRGHKRLLRLDWERVRCFVLGIGPKTVDCIFLRYGHQSIAYRFLVVKSDVPDIYVDTIMESRNATFFENIFPMKDMHSTSRFSSEITPELNAPTEVFEPQREINLEEDNNEAPRKSKRQMVEKFFGNDFIIYLVDDTPTSISEAYASLDADNWKEAVQSELDSILSNGTWELTERPYGCKPVGWHSAVFEGYSDANWISYDELYVTSGYVFMFGGGGVS
ncbi:hypothetical protein U9M48_043880 [Paspalum notatum var. saurae]|uniref:CCHC-type domain-containing protein n=1 Tax=Paspalum notatum var. saurae TaxID=547442 RepID=A0AAQ3XG12_PASNO